MSIDAAIDGIAEGVAGFCQALAPYLDDKARQDDFLRIVYNVKQVAFNVFATGAVLSVLFACATGAVVLPIGLAIAFWTARTLVLANITKDLETVNLDGVWGILVKAGGDLAGADPLNSVYHIAVYVQSRLKNWNPGLTILGMTVYRNVIFRENLS